MMLCSKRNGHTCCLRYCKIPYKAFNLISSSFRHYFLHTNQTVTQNEFIFCVNGSDRWVLNLGRTVCGLTRPLTAAWCHSSNAFRVDSLRPPSQMSVSQSVFLSVSKWRTSEPERLQNMRELTASWQLHAALFRCKRTRWMAARER